jgi:hypothetical protein
MPDYYVLKKKYAKRKYVKENASLTTFGETMYKTHPLPLIKKKKT